MSNLYCYKTWIIGLCILTSIVGLVLTFIRDKNSHDGKQGGGTIHIKTNELNVNAAEIKYRFRGFGFALVLLGMFAAIYSAFRLNDCNIRSEIAQAAPTIQPKDSITSAIIEGCVKSITGNPISGAIISFVEIPDTTYTGEDGCFRLMLRSYQEDHIHIKIVAEGYKTYLPTVIKTNSYKDYQITEIK